MVQKKLRQIYVDGLRYYWWFRPRYRSTGNPAEPFECYDRFVAFLESNKRSPLRIDFITWESPIIGGPLRTGAPLLLNDNCSPNINLHEPGWAAKIIRQARRLGWQPEVTNKPWQVTDGVDFLLKL